MKTHEITTSKGEFVVVDRKDDLPILTFISNMYDVGLRKYICKLSEATEDDASNIIETLWNGYKNYELDGDVGNYNRLVFKSTLESLHSLLKSKGIDVNNGNWYLFKKI